MSDNPNELQALYHAKLNEMQALKDKMAAQGLIVKDEPHTALYTSKTRELMAARDRQSLTVLVEIGNYADEMGWCYPNEQTIGTTIGYSPSTVIEAMSRLMKKDWLRVSMVWNRRRKRFEKDLVLSPAVLYIRPEIRNEAWQRFVDVPHFDSWEELKQSVTKNIKPYTEPATATNIMNQLHEPTPEPSPSSSRKVGTAKNQNGTAHNGVKPPSHSAKAQTDIDPIDPTETDSDSVASNERSNTVNPTGHSAPPVPPHPPLPDGFDPKQPLPDARDEAAAKRLHGMFKTLQMRRARMYIAMYDRETVITAATIAHDSPHVRNPVGKMDSDLRKSLIEKLDNDPYGARRFLSGADAAWYET